MTKISPAEQKLIDGFNTQNFATSQHKKALEKPAAFRTFLDTSANQQAQDACNRMQEAMEIEPEIWRDPKNPEKSRLYCEI